MLRLAGEERHVHDESREGPLSVAPRLDAVDTVAQAWVREATRLHDRYVLEVVEHFGLCPWATRARLGGKLRVEVSLQSDDTALEPSLATLGRWALDESMEVGFMLFPRLPLPRADFDRFTSAVRSADSKEHALGSAPFAMVGFHPEASPSLEDAERLIPFLRRTPDPCIQVIRVAVLDRVRGSVPEGTQFVDVTLLDAAVTGVTGEVSVRDRVGRANLETARRVGVEELRRCMDDIRRDRDATYRRLGGGT
jgi:hypothetical protein